VNDEFGKLGCLLSNFTDASGSVLTYLHIDILKAVEDAGEDFSFNNDLSKIDSVLGNLSEALANVALELCVGVGDKSSKVWYCTLVNYGLG